MISKKDYEAIEKAKNLIDNIYCFKTGLKLSQTLQEARIYFDTWVLPELEGVLERNKNVRLTREEKRKAREEELIRFQEYQEKIERDEYERLRAKFQ